MRKAPLIGLGIVIGAIAIAVAGGTPTKTGDLNVNGSASITGSAYIAGSAFQAGQQVVSNAGTGLTKSGSTLFLFTGCGSGQILKWNGTVWNCAADAGGFDTAGSGLGSSGTTVFLNITPTSCAAGSGVTGLNSLGSATCTADVTSVVAGTGIGVSTTAGAATVSAALAGGTCAAGSGVSALSPAGAVTCSADVTSVVSGTGITASTVSGAATVTANLAGASCSAGNAVTALSATGTGTCSSLATLGAVAGTGTSGRSTRWTSTTGVGNGAWTDDGTNASANGTTTVQQLISTQISPAAITGATNDWNPTGLSTATTILVTSSSSTILLNGVAGGTNGRRLVIVNHDAAQSLIIRNENAGSTTTNRIVTNYGDDVLLGPGLDSNVTLEYWASRWRVTAINTFTPPGMSFQGQVTAASGLIQLASNGNIVTSGGTVEGALMTTPSFGVYMSGSGLGFQYFTAGAATGYINPFGNGGTTSDFRSLEIDDGKGSGAGHALAFFDAANNGITMGSGAATLTKFTNTPNGGAGTPDGLHIESFDEMLGEIPSSVTGGGSASLGDWTMYTSGTGAAVADTYDGTNGLGRPGLRSLAYTASSTSGNYAAMVMSKGFYLPDGVSTIEFAVMWSTLSSTALAVASPYISMMGFNDGYTGIAPTNGCYFAYDAANLLTSGVNAGTVQALECWCAKSGTRTGYLINNTGNSDNSFPLGVGTVAAATWYRLKIVITGTTPKAEFYRNNTKVCEIATNIPNTSTLQTQPAISINTRQTSGTGARGMSVDWARVSVDLTSVRSP